MAEKLLERERTFNFNFREPLTDFRADPGSLGVSGLSDATSFSIRCNAGEDGLRVEDEPDEAAADCR